ncbi:MAG: bifunctional enzyme CysN/CysC [Sphingomonadales bacterium]|jgi:bifunctional enzyme CysN/CysC|nr:bifunctional enzyme CysN/CysC [Sphingomonadales bacterium]
MEAVIPAKAGTSGQEDTASLPEVPAYAGMTDEDPVIAGQNKSLLRLLTCGSVDDGKSTLLGRLLYDSKMLFEDQLAALEADSRRSGTQGQDLDFALLVDGLSAEREQGITIDVAYRFFATDRRKFIVADTPGHEQYTRNMVTGASTADLAIILIDARKGVLTQTRRHSHLVHLLGIRHVVLAVNKMDMVDYGRERFETIVADYRAFADEIGIGAFTAIPIAALAGDNIAAPSPAMPWYEGPPLLEHLETVPLAAARPDSGAFHMAVQWVNRPDSRFRGYAGRIAGGSVRPGDEIVILPSGRRSRIERIVTFDGALDRAVDGQSVTLTLADEVDCSRGEVIASIAAPAQVADGFVANLVWMGDEPLAPGRAYWLKIGASMVSATVSKIEHIVEVDTGRPAAARLLALNDIARCELRLDREVAAIPYARGRELGAFILIDKLSHATAAAGMIDGFPRRAALDRGASEADRIVWLNGVAPEERAEVAAKAQQKLQAMGRMSFILDEASLRESLNADLGGDPADLAEHIRRVRAVVGLMSRAGLHVLVAVDVPTAEAWPGRQIDRADLDQGGEAEWVI